MVFPKNGGGYLPIVSYHINNKTVIKVPDHDFPCASFAAGLKIIFHGNKILNCVKYGGL